MAKQACLCHFLLPPTQVQGVMQRAWIDVCMLSTLCSRKGTQFREFLIFIISSKQAYCLSWQDTLPNLLKLLSANTTLRNSSHTKQSGPCIFGIPSRHVEIWYPWGTLSHQSGSRVQCWKCHVLQYQVQSLSLRCSNHLIFIYLGIQCSYNFMRQGKNPVC